MVHSMHAFSEVSPRSPEQPTLRAFVTAAKAAVGSSKPIADTVTAAAFDEPHPLSSHRGLREGEAVHEVSSRRQPQSLSPPLPQRPFQNVSPRPS